MKKGLLIKLVFCLVFIFFIFLSVVIFYSNQDYSSIGVKNLKQKDYVEPAWDIPDWAIDICEGDMSMKELYRCDLDLFLYTEGAWETSAIYLDYNGNNLTGYCDPFRPSDACVKYEGECSKMELICPQGEALVETDSEKYNKNDTVKINYNFHGYYASYYLVADTYIEKLDENGQWIIHDSVDVEIPKKVSNFKINFIGEWDSSEEGFYRVVVTDESIKDLSNCNKVYGTCEVKKNYSDIFEIIGSEQSISNCVGEGELISSLDLSIPASEWRDCCGGLTKTTTFELINGVCYSRKPVVCTNCGNGECGPGEDICNCPQDCGDEIDVSDWRTYDDEVCGFTVKMPNTFSFNKTGENTGYWFGSMSIHSQGGYFLHFRCDKKEDLSVYNSFYCDNYFEEDERCELYMWNNNKVIIDWDYEEKDSKAIAKIYKNENNFAIIDIDSPPQTDEAKEKFLKIVQSLEFN